MSKEELILRAKELGVKGNVPAMKEETLIRKISELEVEEPMVEESKVEEEKVDKFSWRQETMKEFKKVSTPVKDGKFKYIVKRGSLRTGGVSYSKGETFESNKGNLDKVFEVEKV